MYKNYTHSCSQPYLNSMDHHIHKKDTKEGGGLGKTKGFHSERLEVEIG